MANERLPAMRTNVILCAALAVVAAASGCAEEKATQIVVAVATNLSVPKEMDSVNVHIGYKGAVKANLNYNLDPGKPNSFELPATVAIHAAKEPKVPITITVTGKKASTDVVARTATLSFVEGRILLLKMDLLRSCVKQYKTCSTGATCTAKGCVSSNVDASKLPDYTGKAAFTSPEAGVVVDAASDLTGDMVGDASGDAGADGPMADVGQDAKPDTAVDLPAPDITPDITVPDTAPSGTITITAPTGGSHAAGSSLSITWTSTGSFGNVDIDLYKGTKKESTIAQSLPNGGSFIWKIPASQPSASTYLIKVVATKTPSISGASTYFTIGNWQYQVVVNVDASKATSSFTNYPVAISLSSSSFSYSNAMNNGADLRFSSSKTLTGTFDLPHWIQKWDPTGTSVLWVNVPVITAGSTKDIYLFYGKSGATSTASKTKTFPKMFVSTKALSMGGNLTYDWFELTAAHVLTLNAQKPLSITARRLIIAGTIQGTGLGNLGGTSMNKQGTGAGGGGGGFAAGGGGGGYGGKGGNGGWDDTGDNFGLSGKANGIKDTTTIQMGSGGGAGSGSAGVNPGGTGGGAVTLLARDVVISGTIALDGGQGSVGDTCGGGGSGGGVLIQGDDVSVTGTLSAQGGAGGSAASTFNDGGGGGGGGRVKVYYDSKLENKAIITTAGGAGGKWGNKSFGLAGDPGTIHFGKTTYGEVSAALGAEKKL